MEQQDKYIAKNSNEYLEAFNSRLNELMEAKNFKIKELTEELNKILNNKTEKMRIKEDTVRSWVDKRRVIPRNHEILFAICELFGCDLDYLFGKIDNKTHEIDSICKSTGLSGYAVENIIAMDREERSYLSELLSILNPSNIGEICYHCLKYFKVCEEGRSPFDPETEDPIMKYQNRSDRAVQVVCFGDVLDDAFCSIDLKKTDRKGSDKSVDLLLLKAPSGWLTQLKYRIGLENEKLPEMEQRSDNDFLLDIIAEYFDKKSEEDRIKAQKNLSDWKKLMNEH